MKAAPFHSDEDRRIELLERLEILDTEMERQYSEITELASTICKVPISLVSLVDRGRQWFKARTGLDAADPPP